MHIKELTVAEFDAFSKNNPMGSYYQSSNYALFMAENGYDYELIGLVDELGVIKAAALILIKKISMTMKYGYSPKGFLIDYFDLDILKIFIKELKKYYEKKLIFIKINPEIAIGEINRNSKLTNYNQNIIVRDYLKELGLIKLKDNLYFESLEPRFNAILNLKEYNFDNLAKNTKNKVRKALKRGLIFEKADRNSLDTFYEFVKNKKNVDSYYYKSYYNIFEKDNNCDLFLVKIDYEKFLLNSKELYDKELINNNRLSEALIKNSNDITINEKMNSDRILLAYKNDIEIATLGLKENRVTYVAGALTIKYKNRVNIVISGIEPKYKRFNANYFLHYKIIEYYKNNYRFLDLNGITGNFDKASPYNGLNEFKFGFKPNIYEFIGEFDYVLNDKTYKNLISKGLLAKEFNNK
ncbi:MAG: aminoacyltransferase [Ruminococcus sp.]|nr:aminoacyltransferase [Ruminococcus sp.]